MDAPHRLMKRLPLAGGALAVIVLVSGLVWWIHGFMATKNQKPARVVQNITVIRPPPPPPPEEAPPPPPPDKVDEPIPQNQPDPTPDDAPAPAPDLGLDAEGSAGSDAFGLAARKGGSDIAGSGGAIFAWYTNKLRDQISDRLSSDPKLRGKKFTAGFRIWLEADGRIKDAKLTVGSGSIEVDREITAQIAPGVHLDGPPLELPQPISLQIVSRS
jgi:periplasmic protein TonB